MTRVLQPRLREVINYWPHAGIAAGIVLNGVGIVVMSTLLIGTASNLLVICGLFLGQRKRNEKRNGEGSS